MKLKNFFEMFDQIADAPDAVPKMRELVLKLAVTGKLVSHNKRDEPAQMLLESMAVERAMLVAKKKIKSRPTVPVNLDEQPFNLPSSWSWARLSDVGHELGQKVPDRRFTYIDVGGIDSDKGLISERVEKLEPSDAPSRARKLVARDTVIYSTIRPYLLNIAIVDKNYDPEPIASTAFAILHPFEGINNRYLFYWLRSAPFTAYVQASMKGMAYPAINDENFYRGYIALPPLAEQKRIVAKVDELMALCDRLEAQQQERVTQHAALVRASLARFADAPSPTNLDFIFHKSYDISAADLRKTILTLAVQGKLVPQDPNDEPVGVQKRKDTPQTLWSNDIPFDVPYKWSWQKLGLIALIERGGSPRPIKDYLTDDPSGLNWIKIGDTEKGGKYITSTQEKIRSEGLTKTRKVFPGDFLLTNSMSFGRPYISKIEGCIHDGWLRIHPPEKVIPDYLYYLLSSPYVYNFFSKEAAGAVVQNLNADKVRGLKIPIPPLAEQRRIVDKVEKLMALVDELEAQLASSHATGQKLLAALVAYLTIGK